MFAVSLDYQQASIEAYCYGACGQIIVGALQSHAGTLLPCRHEPCPYLVEVFDAPVGIDPASGEPLWLRRLAEPPA